MPRESDALLECSIQSALSSIEIYNKPDFKYREEIFSILIINSWELLIKAKILKDSGEDLNSIYVKKSDGSVKTNRTCNPMTIEIFGAMKMVDLDGTVIENIGRLVDIRDTAIHYYHTTSLSYLMYILGAATLRNYQKVVNSWFNKSLSEYNFYIMPLAFRYDFRTLNTI